MNFRRSITGVLILVLLGVAAVSYGQEREPGQEQEPPGAGIEGLESDNPLSEVKHSFLYESMAGDFSVRFPSGCGRYRERIPTEDDEDNGYTMVKMAIYVYCDRQDRKNEGCSVVAYVDDDLDAGQPADPDFVLARVRAILTEYGVSIVNQKPVHLVVEDGPRMEGVDVLATDPKQEGQVWVRGLLVEGDVYILVSWRAYGTLENDPEIVEFFESFRAHT